MNMYYKSDSHTYITVCENLIHENKLCAYYKYYYMEQACEKLTHKK